MNTNLQKLLKFTQIFLLLCLIYTLLIYVNQNPQLKNSQNETVFFRKSALNSTTNNWVINGRYSKDETECIENCMRQGGINCGGVLYFACCKSQEKCITYPLGIAKCYEILPDFRCFRPS
ncbi:hypothetical protein ABPG72_014336 [Tetrahymena utriculariae]